MEPRRLSQAEIEEYFFNDLSKLDTAERSKRKELRSELERINCFKDIGILWDAFISEYQNGAIKIQEAIGKVVRLHSGVYCSRKEIPFKEFVFVK